MHTKSHPQNSEISQAVADGRVHPAHCRVAHGVRVTAMYWVEGVSSSQPMIWAVASNATPTPWSRVRSHFSFVWREQEFRSIPVILE